MAKSLFCLASILTLIALPLAAQETSSPESSPPQTSQAEQAAPKPLIEEIIITAEKREARVQETPIAVTALTSDMIEQGQVYSPAELQFNVPSMTYGNNAGYSFLTIRGVGTDLTTTSGEPSVATYEDGIYTGQASQHIPGFDLERIEVLRGPQGTLYGRNAVGGVVNFISKLPSFEPEANVGVAYGNYNTVQIDAGATGGIVDETLAGRIGVRYESHDGYRHNRFSGDDEYELDQFSLRAALLFTPSEDFSITVRGGFSEHQTSNSYMLISSLLHPSAADPLTNITGGPYGTAPLGIFSMPAQFFIDNPGYMSPADITSLNGGSISDFYGLSPAGPVPPNPSKTRDFVSALPSRYEVDTHNFSATLDWDTGAASFKSITAYRYSQLEFDQESTGAGALAVTFIPLTHVARQFTQELSVSGAAFDERLDWLAGAFYFLDNADFGTSVWIPTEGNGFLAACATTAGLGFLPGCTTSTGAFPFTLIPQSAFPYSFFQQFASDPLAQIVWPGQAFPPNGSGRVSPGDVPETSFLGFAGSQESQSVAGCLQATYHVTDRLRLTGGLRYTWDQKKSVRSLHSNLIATLINLGLASATAPDGTPTLCDKQHPQVKYDDLSGTAGADYDLSSETLVYAKYSRGYKAGGINSSECGQPFNPEHLSAYETGVKSIYADGQILTNAAFYYYDYTDIQFTLFVPNQAFIRNAGTATAYGLEVEYLLRPEFLEGVQLDGSLSWEHSEYGRGFFQDVGGIIKAPPLGPGIPIKGNELIRAPEWKANLAAQYTSDVGNIGSFTLRIEGAYTATIHNDVFNGTAPLSPTTQPSYWLGNARVIWNSADDRYQAVFSVDNFTEELYSEQRVSFNTPGALMSVSGQFAAPRTFGARFSMKFGGD
jgi:iron complex outermembrane recepter protein